MPEELLNGADVVPVLEEMRRERVAQGVRRGVFRDPGAQDGDLHGALEHRFVEVVPAPLAGVDEPTAGMTPGETKDATTLIRQIARSRGLTLLLIEHDMSVVMGVSDRVAVLHFGEKIAEGPPAAIRSDPRVIDAYLGGVDDD